MIPESVFEQSLDKLFAPIGGLLSDPSVSEVMINGPACVFVERRGRIERTQVRFASESALNAALMVLAQYVGRPFDREHPVLEGRLPDGSRVEVVHGSLAKHGTHVAIRRFAEDRLSLAQLVAWGTLSPAAAEFLRSMVADKRNILVAGGTGSGKTSLLNVLTGLVPDGERVVVLEDARELQPRGSHAVQLEARPADERGRGAVSIRELLRATLRLRPDRIVIGEIRDGSALDLLQAMTSGHGGCMATLHASHPRDALTRLETMALMAEVELPLLALRTQIASAVDVVVQVERVRSGARLVTQIAEVAPLDGDGRHALRERFVRAEGELVAAPREQAAQRARDVHGGHTP